MKRFLVGSLILLAIAILAVSYFLWWRPTNQQKDLALGQPLMPKGWKVSEVQVEILKKIDIPFLHQQLVGKKVMIAKIRGDGISFSAPKTDGYHNDSLTQGTITTLADTGQLIRIELFGDSGQERVPGQMTLEKAEAKYRNSFEMYEGLPSAASKIPLESILSTTYSRSYGEIEKSRRIEVLYVNRSVEGILKAEAFWVVSCFGFPPFPSKGPFSVGPEPRSRLRHLINSEGRISTMDNSP